MGSKNWEIIKCFPMDWQRIILAYGFDKRKFYKVIEEIKLLNFQMYAFECSEANLPLSSIGKRPHKFLRTLTEIIKIRKIRGVCLICGAIRAYEGPSMGLCICEDRDTVEKFNNEFWRYMVPKLIYNKILTNKKKYPYTY